MSSIAYRADSLRRILEEEATHLARESGFVQRERNLSGADFAQTLIFGWWQVPQETLDGLSQVAQRREVSISASGLCQRFTQEAATFLQRLLQRLTQVHLQVEPAHLPLLSRFAAVVVEDCSSISLPDELETCFRGAGAQRAGLKLWVRWDVLGGHLQGPLLTEAREPESRSPFNEEPLPDDGLYLADLAFFSLQRLQQVAHPQEGGRGWFVMRLNQHTALYTHSSHRIELAGVVPRQEGELRELGVLLGKQARLPVRLLMLRVPEEVAEQRREHMREEARTHGRNVSEQALYLAGWTLLVTNVPTSRRSLPEVLVMLGVRWQIERLFRLWKDEGQVDEWRSKKRWRILCELYAKLAAMLIQQWLLQVGSWQDPHRSLVKGARALRREANRIMVALWEGSLEQTLEAVLRTLRSGTRQQKRRQFPSTAQRLEGAPLYANKRKSPPLGRHHEYIWRWPAGKGWACSQHRTR
jgi:hypothetical protein